MASLPHASPTGNMPLHHPGPPAHQPNGHVVQPPKTVQQALAQANEGAWVQIGSLCEHQNDLDGAIQAYEQALRHNTWSVPAMQAMSCILRGRDQFALAIDYLKMIIKVEPNNGEVWGSLGHCYLMLDNLQEAYSAYQQAIYHLQDLKEPKLWYGIGILYDRYGSLEHAEEAFSQVMRMAPDFEKANEIYFRLGIIYKQQGKFAQSLECFKYIVSDPPRPLTEEDIWFQIGHVHEQQKDFDSAKIAYKRVLERDPNHAKVLQQLGWLHHQQSTSFQSQEQAINYLEMSVASDQNDAQSWYLLGRCYMAQQKYPKAYEAYQQAVYRDGKNPTFWCSIGVLYYQINQYRDALDAYSRAIRLNPNISEVWYDLGTLYESCNNQTADALDAYQRAADLDPTNVHIKARLQLLQNGGPAASGMPNQNSAPPLPQDVHPQAYQPAPVNGPPGPQWGAPPPSQPHHTQPAPSFNWNQRLAEIQPNAQPPPQQLQQVHMYDQRDGIRPLPSGPPRLGSPRQDHLRQIPEPTRTNATPRRGMSPSPKSQNATPSYHQAQHHQGWPNHPPPPPGPPPPSHGPPAGPSAPQRIANPNYGAQSSSVPLPGSGGPLPGAAPSIPRLSSPLPPEVRPIIENRPTSAGSSYQHPGYPHHPNSSAPGIAMGAPAPTSALAAAEAAARERDDRTPTAPKRLREWEDEPNMGAKHPNDEKRQRLDEPVPRPPSVANPVNNHSSPPPPRHAMDADLRRAEDQRRANENYHPSEAAHHPALPSLQQQAVVSQAQPPPQLPRLPEPIKDERPREPQIEPVSRKMEVDENYDDEGEDDKRALSVKADRESPRGGNVTSATVTAGSD